MNKYREGKVKSTPTRGVKENLKPNAYKQSEGNMWLRPYGALTAYLLHNGSVTWYLQQA